MKVIKKNASINIPIEFQEQVPRDHPDNDIQLDDEDLEQLVRQHGVRPEAIRKQQENKLKVFYAIWAIITKKPQFREQIREEYALILKQELCTNLIVWRAALNLLMDNLISYHLETSV